MSSKSEENHQNAEALFVQLLDLIPKFYPNRYYYERGVDTINQANKIVDALLTLNITEENIKNLCNNVKTNDMGNEEKRILQMTLREAEAYILEKKYFKENLESFWNAYIDDDIDEEECIRLISHDPDIQKQQLQMTLGLGGPNQKSGRLIRTHKNQRLKLQESLINKLAKEEENSSSVKSFFSSVLREFVLRSCDAGQIPCPNASITMKLLIEAGADPNLDHLYVDYQSPGADYLNRVYSGVKLYERVSGWTKLSGKMKIENEKMQRELKNNLVGTSNSPEILLCNLIYIFHKINKSDRKEDFNTAKRLIEELVEQGYKDENLFDLIEFVRTEYFKKYALREDDDDLKNEIPKAFSEAETFIRDFIQDKKQFEDFQTAFQSDEENDDECIRHLSDNPETLKKQLQIALGLYTEVHTPWYFENNRVDLQKEIIDRIEDKTFLNDVLRDFIFQCCCFGQIPCNNAAKTVQLLIDAGADPNMDHFDISYASPGAEYTKWNDGCSLYEEVSLFSFGPIFAGKPIWDILSQVPKKKTSNSPELLLCKLINTASGYLGQPEDPSRKNIQRARKLSKELLSNVESLEELYYVFHRTKYQYFPNMDKLTKDDPKKIKLLSSFRSAEALILETLYQYERYDEHHLLHMMKVSLIFAPLILPLIFTAIVAILYAIKKHNTTHQVQKTDLRLEEFTDRFTDKDRVDIHHTDNDQEIVDKIEHSYAMKFPLKSKGENKQLRKAVVFNRKLIGTGSISNPYARFVNIFNGTSEISPKEEGKLRKDVRIYEVNSDEASNTRSR